MCEEFDEWLCPLCETANDGATYGTCEQCDAWLCERCSDASNPDAEDVWMGSNDDACSVCKSPRW